MNTMNVKSKEASILLGVMATVAFVTLAPHAFAQSVTGTDQSTTSTDQSNPIGYTDQDSPYGPLQMPAWGAGLAIAAVMSGIGVWSAVRRR